LAKDGVNLQGRSANNRVIHIPVPDQNMDEWIGKIVNVEITEVLNYTLRGELLHTHASSI
jgi:tRNA-2-methylthio-N6-dimethylallyladenosine synthase